MEVGADLVQGRQVVQELGDRLIVLVDEHDNLLPLAFVRHGLDQVLEILLGRLPVVEGNLVVRGEALDQTAQVAAEILVRRARRARHREVEDGKRLVPLPRERVYGKPLEQLAATLEHRLQRGEHERLSETARTRDEELLVHVVAERVEKCRLVDVLRLLVAPQNREHVHPRREHPDLFLVLHGCYYSRFRRICGKSYGFTTTGAVSSSSPHTR